jgi:DNA-binding winged helix-turn-helix (wHTH) protein
MPTSGVPFYVFGPFRLEPAERRVLFGDEPLPLPPKVLDTLVILVEADGRLVARDALMQRLWPDTVVEEVNLARNVSLLRKALADRDGRNYIETVPKAGYRFTAPVARIEHPADVHEPSAAWPAGSRRPLTSGILASAFVAALSIAAIVAWRAGAWSAAGAAGTIEARPNYVRATFDGTVVESVLSPDGSMVASVLRGPPMRLVLRDLATGSTTEALRGEFFFRPKWSPDGSAVSVTWRPAV